MGNLIGMTRGTIKYGYAFGPRVLVGPCAIGASEVFKDTGGKFVKFDNDRQIEVALAADTALFGWAECGKFTASSTEGKDKVMVDISCESVYYIPADEAVTIALRGKTCDFVLDSNRQRADVGVGTTNVILIVDVDIANQAVYVQINRAKQYATSVT